MSSCDRCGTKWLLGYETVVLCKKCASELEVATPSASDNNARDEILLCDSTVKRCYNMTRSCKLKAGACNGQRKTSPVA